MTKQITDTISIFSTSCSFDSWSLSVFPEGEEESGFSDYEQKPLDIEGKHHSINW